MGGGEPVNGVSCFFSCISNWVFGGRGEGLALQLAPGQRLGIELRARDCTVYATKVLLTFVTPF